jgi:small multidrug resistance family-3 protein
LRESKPWWWAVLGAIVLFVYGVIPTFQPVDNFGRVYAVYGGFFILLSYFWGWAVDGDRPDTGVLC